MVTTSSLSPQPPPVKTGVYQDIGKPATLPLRFKLAVPYQLSRRHLSSFSLSSVPLPTSSWHPGGVETPLTNFLYFNHIFGVSGFLQPSSLMNDKLLGHNKVETMSRYAHLANDPLKAAANRIATRIARVAG